MENAHVFEIFLSPSPVSPSAPSSSRSHTETSPCAGTGVFLALLPPTVADFPVDATKRSRRCGWKCASVAVPELRPERSSTDEMIFHSTTFVAPSILRSQIVAVRSLDEVRRREPSKEKSSEWMLLLTVCFPASSMYSTGRPSVRRVSPSCACTAGVSMASPPTMSTTRFCGRLQRSLIQSLCRRERRAWQHGSLLHIARRNWPERDGSFESFTAAAAMSTFGCSCVIAASPWRSRLMFLARRRATVFKPTVLSRSSLVVGACVRCVAAARFKAGPLHIRRMPPLAVANSPVMHGAYAHVLTSGSSAATPSVAPQSRSRRQGTRVLAVEGDALASTGRKTVMFSVACGSQHTTSQSLDAVKTSGALPMSARRTASTTSCVHSFESTSIIFP